MKAVELKREFPVPVEKLYSSWIDPKIFAQWWKGLVVKELNPTREGKYRFEWVGTPDDYAEGQFQELTPHSKIVFTWTTTGGCAGQEEPVTNTRVTLLFRALGNGKSELTLRHDGFTTEAQHQAHLEGWISCLCDLARFAGHQVVVKRELSAPVAKVFEAWTNPDVLRRWFSPGEWKVEVVAAEARAGGTFHFQLKGAQARSWGVHGSYLTVKPNELLSFTWNTEGDPLVKDTVVDVAFRAVAPTRTEVIVTHSGFLTQPDADEHEWGWNACEDQLVKILA